MRADDSRKRSEPVRLAGWLLAAWFLGLLLTTILIRVGTTLAIPGWATYSSGLLFVISAQMLIVAFVGAFFILNSRNNLSFVPVRDYRLFVDAVRRVHPAGVGAAPDA